MPIETGTTIAQLIATWPLSGDFVSEGDNHLNLIKDVLKKQFPGANEQGFDTPILATEAELNFVQDARANIQAQIDNIEIGVSNELGAPPGTTMIFFDSAPPNGWTQLAANNDSLLRVVSGSGGGAGGSTSPIAHNHATSGHTLTLSEMPQHAHALVHSNTSNSQTTLSAGNRAAVGATENGDSAGTESRYTLRNSTGGSDRGETGLRGNTASHTHGNTGTTTPRYINVITAVKD